MIFLNAAPIVAGSYRLQQEAQTTSTKIVVSFRSLNHCWNHFVPLLVLVLATSSFGINALASDPAIFGFGDSILDTGNNNNLSTLNKCNYAPYGRNFNGRIPTGRFSDGRVPTDLIAEALHIKNIVPAYHDPRLQNNDILTGVSFASGGTGLDPLTSKLQSVTPVANQVKEFEQYVRKLSGLVGETESRNIISNSLFLISAGNNDISITYFSSNTRKLQCDYPTYSNMLTIWSSTLIKDLYGLGARKFIVLGTLPLGCLPIARQLQRGNMCDENLNTASQTFNLKLSQEITNLQKCLLDVKIMFFDIYNPVLNIIRNPQQFGFMNGNIGCYNRPASQIPCVDDSGFVFWDYAHPTERTYKIIVSMIIQSYKNQFS